MIKIYCSKQTDPYVVDGEPLAELPIYFKRNYQDLKFKVKYYFGNTRIRVFAMNEELQLNYKFHETSKLLDLKKPPKPIISSINVDQRDLKIKINIDCPEYDDIDCRAWFQVECISIDDDDEHEINDKIYDSLPIILNNLSVGLEYKIRVKCINDKGYTYSDIYQQSIILTKKPPIPRIKVKYA